MTGHRVTVVDSAGITACECGLQVFVRPGLNSLSALFASEHGSEVIA